MKENRDLFVKQYEAEERAWHGPLIAAVFKHDDIENGRQHLP